MKLWGRHYRFWNLCQEEGWQISLKIWAQHLSVKWVCLNTVSRRFWLNRYVWHRGLNIVFLLCMFSRTKYLKWSFLLLPFLPSSSFSSPFPHFLLPSFLSFFLSFQFPSHPVYSIWPKPFHHNSFNSKMLTHHHWMLLPKLTLTKLCFLYHFNVCKMYSYPTNYFQES